MVIRSYPDQPVPALYDVCAVGNAIVDVIADCDEAFLATNGITKNAMMLVDEARSDFLYKAITPQAEMSGGSVANTVTGIAMLGGKPTYIGKVRDDELGSVYRADMRAAGVHFPTVPAASGPATGCSIILVTPDAHRSMNTYLGIAGDLSETDIDAQLIANAQMTLLEGYLFDKPEAQKAFHLAAKMAHDAGRRLALSLSDTFCVERHREAFAAFVRDEVDILIANEFELMSLYQVPTFDEAMTAARAQCSLVVGTRSEKGAVIAQGSLSFPIEAEPVATLVDSTGAGDLFAAGFLFGLTHGKDMATSGRMGAIAASEIISHYGPRPQADLKALMQAKGMDL
ncbi:MAG: adenosine kinase [Alphaproteobacteria bacterium]|nr:adenosine kinase [Alphaproteobacteria bacterium]